MTKASFYMKGILFIQLYVFTYLHCPPHVYICEFNCNRPSICKGKDFMCIEHVYTFLLSLFAKQYTVIIFAQCLY